MTRTNVALWAAALVIWVTAQSLLAQTADDPLALAESALAAAPDDIKAGNDYRKAVVRTGQYDRALAFFAKLVAERPDAGNAHLNYGFAYVDKIPAAGSITQVILANNALGEFTKSLAIKKTWIGLYTRGNSYLFWPRIFNRTKYGIADLEEALAMQRADSTRRGHYVRVYIALGDGYWKIDDFQKATAMWQEGLAVFPDNVALKARLAAAPEELVAIIEAAYDPHKRVDTSLDALWTQ